LKLLVPCCLVPMFLSIIWDMPFLLLVIWLIECPFLFLWKLKFHISLCFQMNLYLTFLFESLVACVLYMMCLQVWINFQPGLSNVSFYSRLRKGYHCYSPTTKRYYMSASVTFLTTKRYYMYASVTFLEESPFFSSSTQDVNSIQQVLAMPLVERFVYPTPNTVPNVSK